MAGSPSQLPRYAPPESDEEKSSTREVDLARMKVNIQILLTPKSLLVEARNRDTVQDVKLMIQGKEGIPLDEFDLVCGVNLLAEDRTLVSLNLQQEPTFYLVLHPKDDVSVFVNMSSYRVTIGAKFWYTVGHVKALAIAKMSALVMSLHMVYQGKQLEDHKTLASYDIVDGSVLQLVSDTATEVKN
ncbi:hypothetical protein NL676_021399 [Syzygium grande]|nr:hypothetical protein NL676_021399 [Syzygium grande]